jgi:hypothetical protein
MGSEEAIVKNLLATLKAEPAAWYVTALSGAAALIIAFGHLSTTEAGTLAGLATALGTVITAFLARPVNVAVISGAAGTILQSLVIFNVRMSPAEVAAVVSAINFALGLAVMRPNLTTLVTLRARTARRAAALRAAP